MTTDATRKYQELYRPQFHFSPEEKWMNDPNGMVYFNGEYHLFYQHHPFGTTWGPMHWGHAVSNDMIHWEHLPIALHPDEHGDIFSGSVVVDWNNTSGFFNDTEPGLVAIYTSAGKYPESDRPCQTQSIAYSINNGRTWMKYEGNPVLSNPDVIDFRNPKVFWHKETCKWIMVIASGQTITIYTSTNLKNWEFASEFGHQAGSHDGVWECPDLFELEVDGNPEQQKWVLFVSIGDNPRFKEGSRTQYFVGSFDGTTFVNDNKKETVLWLDYGRDNYAGVCWSDIPVEDGRRIYIGWMSNWRYANVVPTKEWRSAMTLPRELSLKTSEEGVRIVQHPVKEMDTIKKATIEYKGLTVESASTVRIPLKNQLNEIVLTFEQCDAGKFDIVIQHSETDKTVVIYDFVKKMLLVDRSDSGEVGFSESFSIVQEAPLKPENNKVKLQMFVDTSSIEIFANDGQSVITSLIYPSDGKKELVLVSSEESTTIYDLNITPLESIWT